MARYTLRIAEDDNHGPRLVEIEAATPWLALEVSHAQLDWRSADLYHGDVHVAHAEHLALRPQGVWQINAAPPRA